MAKRKTTKVIPQAKKTPVKKSPAKKSPSANKSRKMSPAEIRLKNKQASINKVISQNMKVIEDLNKKHGVDLDKFVKVKGEKKKKKVKTLINEALNKVTKARKEQIETTIERQIVSRGAYKPKTSNKPVEIPEKTAPKKGIRTIGTYHPWQRTEYVKDLFAKSHFGTEVTEVDEIDPTLDMDILLDKSDKGIGSIDSTSVLILKINTETGKVFTEKSIGVYGNEKEEN
jgi:hypothetical protein